MLDLAKRQKTQKSKIIDELGRDDNLSLDAKLILQNLARTFIEACFNREYRGFVRAWSD